MTRDVKRCGIRQKVFSVAVCVLVAGAASYVRAEQSLSGENAKGDDVSGTAWRIPALKTNNSVLDRAFRIAVGDLMTNVQPFAGGMLEGEQPVILAGLNYDRPWTRDASINVWNWGGSIIPEISRNTLLCVLKKQGDGYIVGGQYWDAVIWVTSAWNYYLFTGDREFLEQAYSVAAATLKHFESTEFDADSNLFWGPACYGDGIAAYPAYYAEKCSPRSGIIHWPKFNKTEGPGVGIPVKALSTNCLYYNSYVVAGKMAKTLGLSQPAWDQKAVKLKDAINQHFWNPQKGTYVYLADSAVNSDFQEGLGISFAILFGVADKTKRDQLFRNAHVTEQGIACVWPSYPRYINKGGFGRHSGTVWPHVQGFWADAAALYDRLEIFSHELFALSEHAVRDNQFAEIYHPETGEIYGGLQERNGPIKQWNSTNRQTWSATAYLRMVLNGLVGIRYEADGIRFQPQVPRAATSLSIKNIHYRKMVLDIEILGYGNQVKSVSVDGQKTDGVIPCDLTGKKRVQIQMNK